jgi:hypothetical protein
MVLNVEYPKTITNGLVLNLDAGFVPSYPRNGNSWYDLSNNGNIGTLINSPIYSGGSIVFDGVDDYMSIPATSVLNTIGASDFTVSMWVKRTTLPPGGNGEMLMVCSGISGNPQPKPGGWVIGITSTDCRIELRDSSGTGLSTAFSVNIDFQPNVWTNLVVVKSQTIMNIYSQGKQYGTSVTVYQDLSTSRTSLEIGRVYWWDGGYWEGNISQSQIYNRSLTTSEVLQNYQSQFPRFLGQNIMMDGLVFYVDAGYNGSYPTTGTTWYDVSGYGRNGTLTNGPTYSTDGGGSIVFDGVDDFCPTQSFALSSQTNCLTFNFWVKMGGSTSQNQFFLNKDGYGFPHITIGRINNSDSLRFNFEFGPAVLNNFFTGTSNIWVNVQIVVTYGNGTAKAYKNGVYFGVMNGQSSENFPYTNTKLNIGGLGYGGFVNGNMSVVQIYDRELSPDEVLQNFNATKSRFGL